MTQPATAIRRRLVLIDLSAIYWACWHATANQELSAAHDNTLAIVRKFAAGADLVAICCDAPPYKRKEIAPSYKAQRDTPPANALEQFRRVKARLEADGLLLWHAEGYEADDLIATATEWAVTEGLDVEIASGDKDLLQLVRPGVVCTSTSSGTRYDSDAVVDKFGVSPTLLGDALALIGDKADNVPGAPGIGPKIAAQLLQEIGTLEDVLEAAGVCDERIKPKAAATLRECAEQVRTSRRLIELYRDATINCAEVYETRTPKPLTTDDSFPEEEDPMTQAEDYGNDPLPELPPPEPHPAPPQAIQLHREPATTAVVQVEWTRQLEPTSTQLAWHLAGKILNSRLFPQFPSQEAILAIILAGRSMGLDAMTSLRCFDMIKGRPAPKAVTLIGLVKRSPNCEYFYLKHSDATSATYVTKRRGEPEPTEMAFTIQDADRAGWLGNDNWKKQPATMLRYRCATALARVVYPDVVAGLTTSDEVEDIQ